MASYIPDMTVLKDLARYTGLLFRGNKAHFDYTNEETFPRPILLLHGFLGTRAVMMPIEQHLRRTHEANVYSMTLGVINSGDIRYSAFQLHKYVESICTDLDVPQVDLIAHSMGGLIGLYYIKKLGGSDRVRRMITLGTPYFGSWWAYLAAASFGLVSRAARQLLPNSFFLRELHTGPIPNEVAVYAIEARDDALVPPCAAQVKGIRVVSVDYGHTSLIFSEEVYRTIAEILTLE